MPLSETQAWPVTSIHSPLGTYPPRRSPLLTGRSIGAWARGCHIRLQLANTSKTTNCDFEVIVPPPCGCPVTSAMDSTFFADAIPIIFQMMMLFKLAGSLLNDKGKDDGQESRSRPRQSTSAPNAAESAYAFE